MLVYTAIAGEAPPEAFVLETAEPTVADLLERAGHARSAMNRPVSLISGSPPESRLSDLGIGQGDLVLLRASGDPRPERMAASVPGEDDTPVQPAPTPLPSRRRKRLTEYEEVTQLLQWHGPYHTDGSVRPLYAVWTEENSQLRCTDWESFRAPDALYYRTYVRMQAEGERSVQAAFDFAADSGQLDSVDQSRIALLRGLLPALHYPEWGVCVIYQHAARFAMSSWIAGAVEFMMFDSFRHAQLFGRLSLAFAEHHDGFDSGLVSWMSDSRLQPLRELIEELQGVLDWGHEILVGGLVVEPLLTAVTHSLLADRAIRAGDSLTPFVCRSIVSDKLRHRADAKALLDLVCGDGSFGAANRKIVSEWMTTWTPKAVAAVSTLAGSDERAVRVLAATVSELEDQLDDAGVGKDRQGAATTEVVHR